jgi:CII-binding regulator of phage lambda lysogenization HflD
VVKELEAVLAQRAGVAPVVTPIKKSVPQPQPQTQPQQVVKKTIAETMPLDTLIKTITQRETEALRTEDPARLAELRIELDHLKKQLYQQVPSSYEFNSLLTRLFEINKKLWATKDSLHLLQPTDEAFVAAAQKVITLSTLKDMLFAEIMTVARKA